eukprot:10899095-Alexandrium_andersonii.AAC.1
MLSFASINVFMHSRLVNTCRTCSRSPYNPWVLLREGPTVPRGVLGHRHGRPFIPSATVTMV